MRLLRLLAIVAFAASLGEATALADSCSQWRNTCISSGPPADGDKNLKKCAAAADECKIQCKKGQKVFVGPFNGQHHPVTSCN